LRFVYDGWNLLAEFNCLAAPPSQTTLLRSYLWGLDLSGTQAGSASEQGAGGVGGLLAVTDSSGVSHFVGYDGNGNVTMLFKATDASIFRYEYGPFGELLSSTETTPAINPFRFSTKYQDDETGLLYYGYRYYNPTTGRWLSRDPLEEKGGMNLYSFAQNCPIDRFDATGLDSVVVFNDNSDLTAMALDKNSVQRYDTGWVSEDRLSDMAAFGAFKSVVSFRISKLFNLPSVPATSAGIGATTGCCKQQRRVTGKSIITRRWYGSVGYGYGPFPAVKWISYSHSGPSERTLVELKIASRIVCFNRVVYSNGPNLIPPYSEMSDYLKEGGFPEHNVNISPIITGQDTSTRNKPVMF
jgi:RHS repeat-associated protein